MEVNTDPTPATGGAQPAAPAAPSPAAPSDGINPAPAPSFEPPAGDVPAATGGEPEGGGSPAAAPAAEPNWRQRYEDSSREGHRLRQQYDELVGVLMAREQGQQPAKQPEPIDPYFGFGSWDAYAEAYRRDPARTEKQKLQYLLHTGQLELPGLKPEEQRRLQQLEGHTRQQQVQRQLEAVVERYPEFGDGQPARKAADAFADQHGRWLGPVLQAFPDAPIFEVVAKAAAYDGLKQRLKALETRLGEVRQGAGTAPASTAGRAVAAPGKPAGSIHEAALRAAARLRAAGQTVPPEMERAMLRAAQGV